MSIRTTIAFATLTSSLALAPLSARANDKESDNRRATAGGEERVLNSHQFLIPALISNPFVFSSFGANVGAGQVKFELPTDNAELLYFSLRFDGQIGIADWVSISFTGSGTGATSTNLDQILNIGALPNVEAGGGVRGKIWSSDSLGLQFAAEVKANYARIWNVNPMAAVEAALGRTSEQDLATQGFQALVANLRPDEMVRRLEFLNISPSLLAAWGMGPVGVQMQIGTEHGVAIGDNDDNTNKVTFGLHTALDIAYWTRYFPISIGLEYALDASVGDDDSGKTHKFAGGMFYSGARDVQLGVSAAWSKDTSTSVLAAELNVIYIF